MVGMRSVLPELPAAESFRLLAQGKALAIDVRSEAEFNHGRGPNSFNHPILTNPERAEVGKTYKQIGALEARRLGESLVAPALDLRIKGWLARIAEAENSGVLPLLYCARGGLRSSIAQKWIHNQGAQCLRVVDGFKGLRQSSLAQLAACPALFVLAGPTGAGKTELLGALQSRLPKNLRILDFEALAQHRGSAFGGSLERQPSQINFEIQLAGALAKVAAAESLLVEDESRTIGKLRLPSPVYTRLSQAATIVLEAPLAERVERIYREYVVSPLVTNSAATLENSILSSLASIRDRLGDARAREIQALVTAAFQKNSAPSTAESAHKAWIERLLLDYYDPRYTFAQSRLERPVRFQGDRQQILDFLTNQFAQ